MLKKIIPPCISYKKVGVMLQDLIDKSPLQMDIFHQRTDEELDKKDKLMTVFDTINTRYGSHTIKLAAEGYSKSWAMRSEMRSPCYTTRWSELAVVRL